MRATRTLYPLVALVLVALPFVCAAPVVADVGDRIAFALSADAIAVYAPADELAVTDVAHDRIFAGVLAAQTARAAAVSASGTGALLRVAPGTWAAADAIATEAHARPVADEATAPS
jgi:hypothetical protein